jgi:transposase
MDDKEKIEKYDKLLQNQKEYRKNNEQYRIEYYKKNTRITVRRNVINWIVKNIPGDDYSDQIIDLIKYWIAKHKEERERENIR